MWCFFFFFNTSLTELTDYVIRHFFSKYSNIMSSLSSNSSEFCPNPASLSSSEASGIVCGRFFAPKLLWATLKSEQGSIFLHFHVLVSFSFVSRQIFIPRCRFSRLANPLATVPYVYVPQINSAYPPISRMGWMFR